MKVFRFMSINELNKFKNGETLINDTIHKAKTNSVGFCFFNLDDVKPEFAWNFMKGVVFPDVCAVFEVDEEKLFKGYGIYSDPNKTLYELMNFIPKKINVDEYSTKQYNNKIFKLLKYTTNPIDWFKRYENFEWKEVNI